MMTRTDAPPSLRTARFTGLAYLATAISGTLSYFVVRPQVSVPGDAAATMARLVEHETLARLGVVADLALVTAGSVTALLFFALFRKVDLAISLALAAFGAMSSATMTIATIFSAKAVDIAVGGVGTSEADPNTVLLLAELNEMAWSIGALFFGLWLIPMGWLVLRSGWMPSVLGWLLVVGGFGYIASCVLDQLRPESTTLVELLTMPASLGEFSMLLYLLFRGVRQTSNLAECDRGLSYHRRND